MWEKNQYTINKEISFTGIGLHSGENIDVTLIPANSNSGIVFIRSDLQENNEIPANFKNVTSAKLCTKIANNFGASVSTVEHLMAAFYICGVDNLVISLSLATFAIIDAAEISDIF